ncbi:MAG TPA: Imm32 family immunity protein [Thermoanaerobaculia bacterium]
MPNFISVEIVGAAEVEIHGDPAGLRRLAATLSDLAARAESGAPQHEHLATSEWAGSELASETQGDGRAVHQVKVSCWPEHDASN